MYVGGELGEGSIDSMELGDVEVEFEDPIVLRRIVRPAPVVGSKRRERIFERV